MTLTEAQSIHFIGIGGIGTSAIAKWALDHGKQVSGSDLTDTETASWLANHGATLHIGAHAAANVPAACDLVVHTVAVQAHNPEYLHAKVAGITVLDYPHALQQILGTEHGIAVAGTHGKSTTTALLAYILVAAQRDPTVIVGTRVRLFDNTNERTGRGHDVLIEADEYNQGILLYQPKHAVVLNVDHDHVDVYPTIADAQRAFATFISHAHPSGSITLNADDPSTAQIQRHARAPVRTFGLHSGDVHTTRIQSTPRGLVIQVAGLYTGEIRTQLFGEHNVRNILAALCVAHALHVPFATICAAVEAFPGTWRRFERRGTWLGATIIDDYAHHPTEMTATLQAARQAFPNTRIVCVFQPHLQSRTQAFAKAFSAVLRTVDVAIVVEVYEVAGRDTVQRISSKAIVEDIGPHAHYARDVQAAVGIARTRIRPGDLVLTIGAGDSTHFAEIAQRENPS